HDALEGCMRRLGLETGLPGADAADIAAPSRMLSRRSTALTDPSSTTPGNPRDWRARAKGQRRRGLLLAASAAIAVLLLGAGYFAGGSSRATTAPIGSREPLPQAVRETVFLAVVSD